MALRPLSHAASGLSPRAMRACGLGILLLSLVGQAKAIDTLRYFPLDLGSTWTMRGVSVHAAGEQPPPYTLVATAVAGKIVDGQKTTKLAWETDADDNDRHTPLFVQDASGTQIVASDQIEPMPLKKECLPVPAKPFYMLPNPVKVGQTFSAQMTSKCEAGVAKISIVSTVLGFTTTVVPAGKFRTLALKQVVTVNATWEGKPHPPTKEIVTSYLARDVGIVKKVSDGFGTGTPVERTTDTEELISTNRKYDASDTKDEN